MHALMPNSDAENQGKNILNKGANIIDNIRSEKRAWKKGPSLGNQSIGVASTTTNENNAKRKKFMVPSDD